MGFFLRLWGGGVLSFRNWICTDIVRSSNQTVFLGFQLDSNIIPHSPLFFHDTESAVGGLGDTGKQDRDSPSVFCTSATTANSSEDIDLNSSEDNVLRASAETEVSEVWLRFFWELMLSGYCCSGYVVEWGWGHLFAKGLDVGWKTMWPPIFTRDGLD
jgi:hypothetical protein